jgi:hypothetical protein
MSLKFVTTSDPSYLCAGDIMIGDMSDINYEYLLCDRPIILLCNEWLKKNFPDIGIKTNNRGLRKAVLSSIKYPEEYSNERKRWLNKTINFPENMSASQFILEKAINKSGYSKPKIYLIHGGNITRESNLYPLHKDGKKLGLNISMVDKPKADASLKEVIYIAAHFDDLNIESGYKVHIDHGLKGYGTANLEISIRDYRKHDYFPKINLHITAGLAGYERTKSLLLGPNSNRVELGAYPKADEILKLVDLKTKSLVCKKLDLDPQKKIIIYAPAGTNSYEKPGGSLSFRALFELYKLAYRDNLNVIVKFKNPRHHLVYIPIRYMRNTINMIFNKLNSPKFD